MLLRKSYTTYVHGESDGSWWTGRLEVDGIVWFTVEDHRMDRVLSELERVVLDAHLRG